MSKILTMAEEIGWGLRQALPKVRQTVVRKLALAVGAMVEMRTPNTSELYQFHIGFTLLRIAVDWAEHSEAQSTINSISIEKWYYTSRMF